MESKLFEYELPSHFIAQRPAKPRDSARLMVLHRQSGQIDHDVFSNLGVYLQPGDCLVVNETRVLKARLFGRKAGSGGRVELLLVKERWKNGWEVLAKPGRRLQPGTVIELDGMDARAKVLERLPSGGRLVSFETEGDIKELAKKAGRVPLPPYVYEELEDEEDYQTVYARDEHSVAAPTAGLHFTEGLLADLEEQGVRLARISLDVGLDTFRPISEEDLEDHTIHKERFVVPERTAVVINETRETRKRVVAVGTTTVRALESAATEQGELAAADGETDLFIKPGYKFRIVDSMITNFHLPRSTLLVLVSAFAGRGLVLEAYETAKREGYRFFSFGDAMLIL